MFCSPAEMPKNELLEPVVLSLPALTPAKKLKLPFALKARKAPMLYCVVALTVLADRVPALVPSPEMFSWRCLLVSRVLI